MPYDPFLMKKLLKSDFVGPWIVYPCTVHRGKVNKCELKKKRRGKHWKWKHRHTDVETKRILYIQFFKDWDTTIVFKHFLYRWQKKYWYNS